MHPHVELDVYVDRLPALRSRCRQPLDCERRIERDGEPHVLGERHETIELARADRRICEEQIVAHRAHDFRFARSRAREPRRPARHLRPADARRLVCLDVRAQREPVLARVRRHAVEVALEPPEVHHRYGRFDIEEGVRHSNQLSMRRPSETVAPAGRQPRDARRATHSPTIDRRAVSTRDPRTRAEHAMAMISCPKCKRQMAEESPRCLYCGHRPSATDAERAEDEARITRLSAMYTAGLGLPGRTQRTWIDRMRDESVTRKVMTAGL